MTRYILLFLCIFASIVAFSQKIKKVSATYTYYAPETMSVEEAKRTALERAKIQAIADEFGTKIAQSSTTLITTDNEKTDTHFSTHGLSDIKGEWIETIGNPDFEITLNNKFIIVKCYVCGKAKEVSGIDVEFEALTLRNHPDSRYASTNFQNGDDLYLYFKSPISGFLNVFLLCNNDNEAYCLLPYKSDRLGAFPIKSDKEYILFSTEKSDNIAENVDEYTLSASSTTEYNELIIVFSPKEFNKTSLNISQETLPKVTTISKFNNWLSKLRTKNDNISTKTITLNITKQ